MAEAEPVIRAVLPDANVPVSIRQQRRPRRCTDPRRTWARSWTPGSPRTTRGSPASSAIPRSGPTSRVRSLTPELSKGLEFDLVVLIDPAAFGQGIEGAVDRYVAMTRATQQLVILTSS